MRACPVCKDTRLIRYSSLGKSQCSNCGATIQWPLKEGQPPLVSNNRDTRREK